MSDETRQSKDTFSQDDPTSVEIDLLDYVHEEERETEMIAEGVKRYRKSCESLNAKGRQDMTVVGIGFLGKVMSRLVPAVEEMQEHAIEMLATDGEAYGRWVCTACLDTTTMAYLTAWCVFAHRHKTDAFDDGYDRPTPRPVRTLAINVARQIMRERGFDVWAEEERSNRKEADRRPMTGQRRRRNVVKEVEDWIRQNVTRVREHPKRVVKTREVERKLDTGAITAKDNHVLQTAQDLIQTLCSSCPDCFSLQDPQSHFTPLPRRGKRFLELNVVLSEYAQRELDRQHEEMGLRRPFLMPMVCPPATWQRDPHGPGYVGGYRHLKDVPLLSARSFRLHTRALEHPVGSQMLRAVNAVQATAWRVNPLVAEALRRVAESEHREKFGLGPAERVKQTSRCRYEDWMAKSSDERGEYDRKRRETYKRNAWREITDRLLTAIKEDEKRKAIWFPCFLDFRGRMYPYPQDLHPQASDPVRESLQFAEGKPVDDEGETWLAMQVAASHKSEIARASPDQQLRWVDDHRQEIRGLARDPLKEIEFWTGASDPWRFFAACCEWVGLQDQGSKFVSHLPVAMDGRCNGLQHLAGLAGDPELGELVNLTPSADGSPRDVYEVIAGELLATVRRSKHPRAQAWLKLDGLIARGTVKQPVMTFPYGVTLGGLQKQILNGDSVYDIPGGDPWNDAHYLGSMIHRLIKKKGGVLSSAKAVRDWLSAIAREFASRGAPLIWENPAGMRVRLANFKTKPQRIRLHAPGREVSFTLQSEDEEAGLDAQEQARSVTACLVHSFDAAHLARTVNACSEAGIRSFAVVHDSFGTHACDAPVMAKLLREQFSEIYSQPWLVKLAEQWRDKSPSGAKVPDPPVCGKLDITKVTDSKYFFC